MMLLKLVHLLAVLVWVGGMFFAYVVLRPAAVEVLEPPLRLRLWVSVFRRFFVWVWAAIALILASGFYMIYVYGGFSQVGHHVHVMLLLGLAMTAIYVYVFYSGYRRLGALVATENWKAAGDTLSRIRQLIAVNLSLGILTVCIALLGAFL